MSDVMTLIEYAKQAPDELTRSIVEIYAETSDIMRTVPIETIRGGAYKYNLEGALGGMAFRGINESFTADVGVINPQTEALYTAGGEADVDLAILRQYGEGRRARETMRKTKYMARLLTDKFFKGDNTTEPREFDGLQVRITGTQLIANSSATNGAALSLAALDSAIDACDSPTHLIMNRTMRTKFTAAARSPTISGNINLTKDDFGRPLLTYNGLPMLVGYEAGPDSNILPFTEAPSGGGTAAATSIYIVRFSEDGLKMIQSAPMMAKDLGELETAPKKRTRIEWDVGMVIEDPYAVVRLSSITNAAIAA